MLLPDAEFSNVIKHTPLVSIDLILADSTGAILMGWRENEPAKNMWFVPGGRIRKGETIANAFERVVRTETGLQKSIGQGRFGGVYEHFYSTNCFESEGFGTHYLVLAYLLQFDVRPTIRPDGQHSKVDWLVPSSGHIHPNSLAYFDLLPTRTS